MKRTKIEWCDHTFNPWTGCLRVSPACDNCYAADIAKRFPHAFGSWQPGAPRKRTSAAYWRQPHAWDREAAIAAARRRVFCASMSDVFDNQADPRDRADLFALIDATPSLDWLLLTKRPQNIRASLPTCGKRNIWLGVTAENQQEHDRRVPILRSISAGTRFMCCEPLLEPVRLDLRGIHWVIVGGESGQRARHMSPAWARSVRDQCRAAGVPLFMKQMSRREPIPDDLMIREFPRHRM